ncbi:hypothetical protein [Serratia phage PCH45]|nr:hypothetical protein [Serratia phage PCH45]
MVESNYPDVVRVVTAMFAQFDAQTAKFPGKPLFLNVKEYPAVQNAAISNKSLDQTGYAMSLHDVYLGANHSKMDLNVNPLHIEPGAMAKESVSKVMIELGRRKMSIPHNGTDLLYKLFFSIYGRRSDLVVTNIYHPETIVAYILTGLAPTTIWNRAKSDMISQSLNNYPVAAKFNVAAFRTYMAKFDATMDINDIYINNQKFKINLNSDNINLEDGGIWDRNSRTFGTWSPFPRDGDYLYGVNLAGFILGLLDNQLAGTDRTKFKQQNWEKRITYLCLSAAMNAYTYSYIMDYVKPA